MTCHRKNCTCTGTIPAGTPPPQDEPQGWGDIAAIIAMLVIAGVTMLMIGRL